MVKKNGQGYRTDRTKKAYGTTRKVSYGRISAPPEFEGKTFETIKMNGAFLNLFSGANVKDNTPLLKEAIKVLQDRVDN